jgi:hypothetical protein
MPGWIGNENDVYKWFGEEHHSRYICGSVEPSGFLIEGKIEDNKWFSWIVELQKRLTIALGRTIQDAEI